MISQAEYVARQGSSCPECGREDVDGGPFTSEGCEAWQALVCLSCGFSWFDVFERSRYEVEDMIARGVTQEQLEQAATEAGVDVGRRLRPEGRGFRFTLSLIGERYRRRSHRGRRIAAVCYHGHYAFMEALFRQVPTAVIVSALARYDSVESFRRKAPASYDEACFCEMGSGHD